VLLALALAVGLWVRHGRRAAATTAPAVDAGAADKPELAVSVACPGCGRRLRAKAELAGKKVKCPGCGKAVAVPGADTGESAQLP
jgi:hypothetical protein